MCAAAFEVAEAACCILPHLIGQMLCACAMQMLHVEDPRRAAKEKIKLQQQMSHQVSAVPAAEDCAKALLCGVTAHSECSCLMFKSIITFYSF